MQIETIVGTMERRHGLPRPDWAGVQQRVSELPADEQAAAWAAFERYWQQELATAWGNGYRLIQRGEVLLTTDLPEREAKKTVAFIDKALRKIDKLLKKAGLNSVPSEDEAADVDVRGNGFDIVIVCQTLNDYLNYTCDFHHEGYEGGVSSGMCIRTGSVHTTAHGETLVSVQETLAHELGHSRLAAWDLPGWLDEGLTMLLEDAVTGGNAFGIAPYQLEEHQTYWDLPRLNDFFLGYSFGDVEDGFALHYVLAKSIVQNLIRRDRRAFREFVIKTSADDGGAKAYAKTYGGDLKDLIPRFIIEAALTNTSEDEAQDNA